MSRPYLTVIMPAHNAVATLRRALEAIEEGVIRSADFTNTMEPERPLKVTLSIGVTAWHSEIKNGDELLRAVDEALHTVKRSGRDAVCGNFRGPKPNDKSQPAAK